MIEAIQSQAELRDLYPFIEEGIAAIKAKGPEMPEIAADVYAAAQSGAITLALLLDGDIPWGWTAFYPSTGFTGEKSVVSWMTYIRPGAPKGLLEELLTYTDGLAISIGASKIEFMTARLAWCRRLAPHGYRITGIVLEKEVSDGQE